MGWVPNCEASSFKTKKTYLINSLSNISTVDPVSPRASKCFIERSMTPEICSSVNTESANDLRRAGSNAAFATANSDVVIGDAVTAGMHYSGVSATVAVEKLSNSRRAGILTPHVGRFAACTDGPMCCAPCCCSTVNDNMLNTFFS